MPKQHAETHTPTLQKQEDRALSLALENYLVIIFRKEIDSGSCRASDIAEAAGVARPSVTSALRMLSRLGYIRYSPYKQINLTEKGMLAGQKLAHRNMVLRDFFQTILQLPEDVSEETACALEHVMQDDVMLRLRQFVLYMHHNPDRWNGWRDDYENLRSELLHGSHNRL